MEKDILTIKEVAEYLQISQRSVYKLAKSGELPGRMVLNKWRFSKSKIDEWMEKSSSTHK